MKKSIFTVLLFSLINIQFSYSQIEFGDKLNVNSKMIYKSNNEYIFFSEENKEFIKVSKDLKILSKTPIKLEGNSLQNFFITGYAINDTYYYYSYYTNIEKNQNYYFLETFNLKTLTSNNDKRKISENIKIEVLNSLNKKQCAFLTTPDSSKVILIHNINNNYDTVLCKVFNNNGKYIFEYKINLSGNFGSILDGLSDYLLSENVYSNFFFTCDNLCNIFTFEKINPKVLNSKTKEKNYYKIYGFYEKGTKVMINTFSYENHDINSLQIKPLPNNSILAFGFYNIDRNKNYSSTGGFIYKKIESKTFKEVFSKKVQFTSEYITKDYDKKQLEEFNKITNQEIKLSDYNTYENPKIIILKDNSFYFMGEQSLSIGNRTSTSSPGVYSGDIFISYITSTGETKWMDKIKRSQFALSGWICNGYSTYIENSNLLLLYNSQYDKDVYDKLSKTSKLFYIKINPTGISQSKLILDYKTDKLTNKTYSSFCTDVSWNISKNEFLGRFWTMSMGKGSNLYYCKVIIPNNN